MIRAWGRGQALATCAKALHGPTLPSGRSTNFLNSLRTYQGSSDKRRQFTRLLSTRFVSKAGGGRNGNPSFKNIISICWGVYTPSSLPSHPRGALPSPESHSHGKEDRISIVSSGSSPQSGCERGCCRAREGARCVRGPKLTL